MSKMSEIIWLNTQANAAELQAQLDAQPDGACINFAPRREYPGPLILNQAVVLEGGGATLWALAGPVLTVRARVCLRNLRIEVTGDALALDAAACAIVVVPDGHLSLENVEVRGLARGLPQEEGVWHYPHGLALGGIVPGVAHDWQLILNVPVACRIESQISGLKITPNELHVGVNTLQVHIDRLPRDFLIDGHVLLSTAALRRRIAFTAYADESPGALRGQGQILWMPPGEASGPTSLTAAGPSALTVPALDPDRMSAPTAPMTGPNPRPARRPARDGMSRLRRDSVTSVLFADTKDRVPAIEADSCTPRHAPSILGGVFLAGVAQPHAPSPPWTDVINDDPRTEVGDELPQRDIEHGTPPDGAGWRPAAQRTQMGVPTQGIFSDPVHPAPRATPDPDASPTQPGLPQDREASSTGCPRRSSRAAGIGDIFKTPTS